MRKLARNGVVGRLRQQLRPYLSPTRAEVSLTEVSVDFQRSVAELLLMCPFRIAPTVHVR